MTLLDKVKAVGGVVHSDGNIFFTNEIKLQALIDQELAQYQAAIVEKDKALENAKYNWEVQIDADGGKMSPHEKTSLLEIEKALAIKPDTSALKALIGEPVKLPHGTKLYAVKGYL